jgi:hypothetical protein
LIAVEQLRSCSHTSSAPAQPQNHKIEGNMSRNHPDGGSVIALSNKESLESFEWHHPASGTMDAAAALVSLTPVAPTRHHHHQQQQQQQHSQNNNQDVISLQYMELEEFLLENSVAGVAPNQHMEQKVYQLSDDHQHESLPEKQYQVSLEQRPAYGNNTSIANNVLELMSGEMKRELQEDDLHRPSLSLTPPDHDNDVVMKIGRSLGRTMSGPAGNSGQEHSTGTSTILTSHPSTRRTNSLCEPDLLQQHLNHDLSPSPPTGAMTISISQGMMSGGDDSIALSPSSSSSSSDGSHVPVTRTRGGGRRAGGSMASAANRQAAARRLKKEPVPDGSKDDKYWKRRAKNNLAAKRSRDLRREKENSILQRVQFLEGQNQCVLQALNQSLDDYKNENAELRERLSRYEPV